MRSLVAVLLLLTAPLAAQEVCATSGTGWPNVAFPVQTGTFTVEYDDTPNAAGSATGLDGIVGMSQAPATGYTQWAVITRLSTANQIDARDSTAYRATTALAYVPGTRYHFRVVITVPARRYSVYVRPVGWTDEVVVAQNFRFRAEQSGVTSLGYWSLHAQNATASHTVCNWTLVSAPPPPPPPPTPVAWSVRQGQLAGLQFFRPPCVIVFVNGTTTTCGPYAVANDSTGLVTSHLTITFTVSP